MKKEEYKTCPNCHNMVDKKDKQCPYCLTSLTRRSTSKILNNEALRKYDWNTNTYTTDAENLDIESNTEIETNIENDSIRDDKQQKKNWELPPLVQKFLDIQKASKAWDKEAKKKTITYIIIFYLLLQFLPIIIETIKSIFWE